MTLTKQQQFHPVCKLSLALAQYIILSKNYPTNEQNLKAKFTVCALSFKLFSLSSRLGAKNNLKLPAFSSFVKVYRWPHKILYRVSKNVFQRCLLKQCSLNMAPEMYIKNKIKRKWHPSCRCHENSFATGPVLFSTKIPRFYLIEGSSIPYNLMRTVCIPRKILCSTWKTPFKEKEKTNSGNKRNE